MQHKDWHIEVTLMSDVLHSIQKYVDLLEQVRTLYGTDGDDELYARVDTGVTIYGGTGNDKCYGKDGDDLFYGGKGDDYFRAGAGNDIFYYELGDGNDLIASASGCTSLHIGDDRLDFLCSFRKLFRVFHN